MTIAYVIGQGNLTVNQFEENKNICIPYYDEDVPTKISFIIGKNTDTNKDITMDVLGHLRTPNESSKFHVFPIPNQLLNGEFCGEVHFTHSIWDFGTWIEYSESPYILTINKADRPSDYECAPTPLLNDYNAEVVIDTSKSPCLQFKSIDTNKLYTGKGGGRNLYINMFNDCESLTSLDLSSFNTSLVTNMSSMFFGCASLTSLDLSSFNTSLVTNMGSMFYGCYKLSTLTLGPDWGINTSISSFDLSYCPLTHDSCLDVFNKLADKTQTATTSATLKLSSTTKALMSDDEIAIATAKGWTVSS